MSELPAREQKWSGRVGMIESPLAVSTAKQLRALGILAGRR